MGARAAADADRPALFLVVDAHAVVEPGRGRTGREPLRDPRVVVIADHHDDPGGVRRTGEVPQLTLSTVDGRSAVPPAVPHERAGLAAAAGEARRPRSLDW